MNLKVNNINFYNLKQNPSIAMKGKYSGVPNFNPRYIHLNKKQSFFTKFVKFIKALYRANFK